MSEKMSSVRLAFDVNLEGVAGLLRSMAPRPLPRSFLVRLADEETRHDSGAQWLAAIIERFTYKPHWREVQISLSEHLRSYRVMFSLHELDSDDWTSPHPRQFQGTVYFSIPWPFVWERSDAVVRVMFEDFIRTIENHEREEWLRFDGQRVKEPHQ